MNSEKVKEIKKALECCINPKLTCCSDCPYNINGRLSCLESEMLKDVLTLINELESENKELKLVTDIANEREYRKKFTDEWRKEYQKELDKQGNGHIAGYPDFDLVYKLYFEQKDRIAELEKENGELKQHITEVEKGIINIAIERNKKEELASKFIDSYNDSLKHFAERLFEKYSYDKLTHEPDEDIEIHLTASKLDETLKEFIND